MRNKISFGDSGKIELNSKRAKMESRLESKQESSTKVAITHAKSFFKKTRKYPLRGYFLGVLTYTTAWDRLWGGDVFLRLYNLLSSASPHMTAV